MKRPGAICLMAPLICVALAFAIPASGASDDYYALMKLDGMIYNLTPNGEKSGLSEVTVISN
jgi:hypothetical protein